MIKSLQSINKCISGNAVENGDEEDDDLYGNFYL